MVVEIERTTRKKPYLGGYRHKKTSVEYHHASAQTMQKPRPPSLIDRYCRDTQTVEQRHRVQQTTNETSTQMTKIGVFVSNSEDKLVQPQRYTTADEHHDMILRKVKLNKTLMSHLMTKPTKWHLSSLVRVSVVRMKKAWVLSYPLSAQRRL